jgi:hypothetical protein
VVAGFAVVLTAVLARAADFRPRGAPIGDDGVITPDNLDDREVWPLSIRRGTLVCEGEAVFVTDGTSQYPLNGEAKGLAKAQPKGRRPLEDIWLRDERAMRDTKRGAVDVDVVRINITPVLVRGVEWCRHHRTP